MQRLGRPERGGPVTPEQLDPIAERLLREVDQINGGIGTAPKFPQTGIFELLWRAWKRTGQAPYRDAVVKALDAMCQGGIYDHLGGGFARYSTDARWLVPHFEKMLYDNAELVDLLTLVWQETRNPLYRQRIEETLDWVEREMLTPEGGFASSLDADSEHEEGKFYVWSEAEIDAVLGERAALFKRYYDVDAEGNWEGHSILNRLKTPALADAETERELGSCRALLLRARAGARPSRARRQGAGRLERADDRRAWRMPGSSSSGRPGSHSRADAFDFIRRQMAGPDSRLLHSWRAGRARHPASVDDYANLCRAALALYEATGEGDFLIRARDWVTTLDRHYWDPAGGGYFFAANDTEGLVARPKTAADSAVPAGNGTLVGVLSQLAMLTGEEVYLRRAEAILETFSGEIGRNFFPLATLLNNVELLTKPLQIVLVGERGTAAFERSGAPYTTCPCRTGWWSAFRREARFPPIIRRPARASSTANRPLMSARDRSVLYPSPTPRLCSKLSLECGSVECSPETEETPWLTRFVLRRLAAPRCCCGKRSPSAGPDRARSGFATTRSGLTTSTPISAAVCTRCRCRAGSVPRRPASSKRSGRVSPGSSRATVSPMPAARSAPIPTSGFSRPIAWSRFPPASPINRRQR